MKIQHFFSKIAVFLIGAAALASCNKDETDSIIDIDYVNTNVAVTKFSLKANTNVMAKLDSVGFAIDLEHGVIFNPDSLPMNAKINKLVADIKYSDYITNAVIRMDGGETRNDTIDYLKNPTDSIDFTGRVTLELSSGSMKKTYLLKVNVHKQEVDSLIWDDQDVKQLPSRLPNPRTQKSIDYNGTAISLIEESNGTYTLSTSANLMDGQWTKNQIAFPFVPEVRSFNASTAALYLLSADGSLYTSTDGRNWSSTGKIWKAILGAYVDTAVGVSEDASGNLIFSQYPLKDLDVVQAPTEFPHGEYSNLVTLVNRWTTSPVAFFVGGRTNDGGCSAATWAFDGRNWIKLSTGGIPAICGATIVPYYSYRNTSASSMVMTEYPAWMIIGGDKNDGTFNRDVYISYDNGVSWQKGDEFMQLPEALPAMTGCDNIVMSTRKSIKLSDFWRVPSSSTKTRASVEVDGDIIYWDCPYIYLIGGFDKNGKLYDTVWRGALARLTFVPFF